MASLVLVDGYPGEDRVPDFDRYFRRRRTTRWNILLAISSLK